MRRAILASCFVMVAAPALADPLPMDQLITLDGVQTVCTGIGDEAQNDPRWKEYPIRVEFSNGGAQYLAGAHLTLKDKAGKTLVSLDCSGSWVLFKLTPGAEYIAAASFSDDTTDGERTGRFKVPASGQKRVVLAFPHIPPNH